MKENFWDNVIKRLPLLSACLIFLTFIYIKAYYSVFGIRMQEYMSISEILIRSIPGILSISFLSFGFIVTPYSQLSCLSQANRRRIRMKIRKKQELIFRIMSIVVTVMVLCVVIDSYLTKGPRDSLSVRITGYAFVCSLFVYLYYGYVSTLKIGSVTQTFFKNTFLISTFLLLAFFVDYIGRIEGLNLRKSKPEEVKRIQISTQNQVQYNWPDIYYIGQTEKNAFLYCTRDSSTHIIDKSQIQKFIVK